MTWMMMISTMTKQEGQVLAIRGEMNSWPSLLVGAPEYISAWGLSARLIVENN
jgi:hypothetical protein